MLVYILDLSNHMENLRSQLHEVILETLIPDRGHLLSLALLF